MSGKANSNAPICAEWTRTAGPDESLIITGSHFSIYTNNDEGKDTRFTVFGNNSILKDAKIQRLENNKVIITLAKEMPKWSMYLIWPGNENGYGTPIAINKTEVWWIGPEKAYKGSTVSIYGRNLSQNNDTVSSYIYVKPLNRIGQWATVTKVNPYKVEFKIPQNLNYGDYEIWVHNGHGGQYGWSFPIKLTVSDAHEWTSSSFNVKNFGAKGDGITDDTKSILSAINAAKDLSYSTVYFPKGTYMISNSLYLKSNIRYKGDGINNTVIKCAPDFSPSSYGLLFAQSLTNLEIKDLTLAGNHNYRGNLKSSIWFRGSKNVRLTNLKFSLQDYFIIDLHEGKNVFIKNCQFTGMLSFLGNCSQLFIDSCHFNLTNDTEAALHSWGGMGVSLTNSTCQDFDNTNSNTGAGWGKGRFFVAAGNFGSGRHTYIGNNYTSNLATREISGVDQNSGEQFLWEGNRADWIGSPILSTAFTTTLSGFSSHSNPRYAVIVKGKGLGQSRKIIHYNDASIMLESPWNEIPDKESIIALGRFADRIVVYNNYLTGKSYTITNDNLFIIGSTGIEPFGGVFNFIADNNIVKNLRSGLSNWVTQHEIGLEPNYFSLYVNNQLLNCRWGIQNGLYNTTLSGPEGTGMLGTIYRNNYVSSTLQSGIINTISDENPSNLDGFVYEHNTFANVKKGFSTGNDIGALPWFPFEGKGIENLVFYKNIFNSVDSNSFKNFGIKITSKVALRENTYRGFDDTYSGALKGPVIEAPYHVTELRGNSKGPIVKSKFIIWNSGTSIMQWSATKNAIWLSLSIANGTIYHEGESSIITLYADPSDLYPGNYAADITVTCGTQTKTYRALFKVAGLYSK